MPGCPWRLQEGYSGSYSSWPFPRGGLALTTSLPTERPTASARGDGPLLSVVITTYASERLNDVRQALDSLQGQTYPNLEIIFVGEKSRELCDHVISYARERQITNLRAVFNDGQPGLSEARNLGIEQARGDIVAFLDDDATAFPDWADEIANSLASDDGPIAVTGPAFPAWEEKSMSWFPEELYWIISCTAFAGWSAKRAVRSTWGMNMAFRNEAFQAAGGFSPNIGGIQGRRLHGEEVEFSLRLRSRTGKAIIYSPKVRVMHKVYRHRLSLPWIIKTSYWTGYTRKLLRSVSQQYGIVEDFLALERGLLRRIVLKLLPATLARSWVEPASAWRTLRITLLALLFICLGYAHCLLLGAMRGLTGSYEGS